MEINEIKELFSQFDNSSLTEFDLRDGQFELYMNKNSMSRGTQTATSSVVEEQVVSTPRQTSTQEKSDTVAPEVVQPADQVDSFDGVEVTSPIVGVVYLQPSPDKPSFKEVGSSVKKGEVICIIEAMKLMNEITSEVDGTISEILVSNEEVVEFGQPLFRIQPN
ncbi:MAG: acetyl-CoA carboxylase biotin carboxyl carrier protein [Enterococcus sp.]